MEIKMSADTPYVTSDFRDGIAVVSLHRPEKRNALNLAMWRQLAETFDELEGRSDVRVVVLHGSGGHFCAGADISEFDEVRADAQSAREYDRITEKATLAISQWRGPTIAAITGYAIGGGCGIALACDFRVADKTAKIGITAARLGIVYSLLDTRLLYRQVGLAGAKRILFAGEHLSAEEAVRVGLVDFPLAEDSLENAMQFAEKLVASAPLTVAGSKHMLDTIAEGTSESKRVELEQLVARAYQSHDYREGRAAFAQKRRAQFRGV
jgi:enoyl-CoA hydratase/carnithine racemase